MNLTLFFRLISMSIFQKTITSQYKFDYNSASFYCPNVYAKDGFIVSLQISNGHYCNSENGYRELGHTMKEVEFGFPSEHEELLIPFAENKKDITNTVGSVPIEVLEQIFEKRGGIDWEKTISIETFEHFVK